MLVENENALGLNRDKGREWLGKRVKMPPGTSRKLANGQKELQLLKRKNKRLEQTCEELQQIIRTQNQELNQQKSTESFQEVKETPSDIHSLRLENQFLKKEMRNLRNELAQTKANASILKALNQKYQSKIEAIQLRLKENPLLLKTSAENAMLLKQIRAIRSLNPSDLFGKTKKQRESQFAPGLEADIEKKTASWGNQCVPFRGTNENETTESAGKGNELLLLKYQSLQKAFEDSQKELKRLSGLGPLLPESFLQKISLESSPEISNSIVVAMKLQNLLRIKSEEVSTWSRMFKLSEEQCDFLEKELQTALIEKNELKTQLQLQATAAIPVDNHEIIIPENNEGIEKETKEKQNEPPAPLNKVSSPTMALSFSLVSSFSELLERLPSLLSLPSSLSSLLDEKQCLSSLLLSTQCISSIREKAWRLQERIQREHNQKMKREVQILRQKFGRKEVDNGEEVIDKEIGECWEKINVLWEMIDCERERGTRAHEEVKKARQIWDEKFDQMEKNVDAIVEQMMIEKGVETQRINQVIPKDTFQEIGIEEIISLLEKSKEALMQTREESKMVENKV